MSFTSLEAARPVPQLTPFFERLERLQYKSRPIQSYRALFGEQMSVDGDYKGKGIPEELYKRLKGETSGDFDIMVSEISDENPRSLHVHRDKVGVKIIDSYEVPEREAAGEGRIWHIFVLDLHSNQNEERQTE